MKTALLMATTLVAVSALSQAFAQNRLPPTTVRPPAVRPVTTHNIQPAPVYNPVPSSGYVDANANPLNPNAVIDPTTPNVRSGDWNAPGAVNLHYMTDTQFAAFETAHPSAVIVNRCYLGQDPDVQIRSKMRSTLSRSICGGGG